MTQEGKEHSVSIEMYIFIPSNILIFSKPFGNKEYYELLESHLPWSGPQDISRSHSE